MSTYLQGARVRIELPRFEDAQQRTEDPRELTISVWPAENEADAEQFDYGPDPEVIKLGPGQYVFEWAPSAPGVWYLAAYAPHPVFTSYFYVKPAPLKTP